MVEPSAGDFESVAAAVSCAPDVPRWVDTRGMLLSGRAKVWVAPDSTRTAGFVTNAAFRALAAKLGFIETAGIAVFTAT
jgi:hypothetical protein